MKKGGEMWHDWRFTQDSNSQLQPQHTIVTEPTDDPVRVGIAPTLARFRIVHFYILII